MRSVCGNTWEKIDPEKAEDFVKSADRIDDENLKYAEEQEKLGNTVTASSYYMRAYTCYRLADYGIQELTDIGIHSRCNRL